MTRAIILASAAAALAYQLLYVGTGQIPIPGSLIKTLPVALLALAAMLGGAPRAIMLGLALGAFGDFLLSRSGEATFLAGMGAFAAGHLAYVGGFGLRRPPMFVALALLALAASTEIWLAPYAGELVWPVRGYVVVICLMAAMAAARPNPLLWAGAACFVLSDLLLSIALFRAPGTAYAVPLAHMLWPAYWLGQCLILLAFLRTKASQPFHPDAETTR
jgi:uncharacterized membrane protein YhhN